MMIQPGIWRGQIRDGIECYYGIRYARLSRSDQPRGCVVATPSEQMDASELTDVPIFPQLPSRLESVTGPGGRVNPQDDNAFFLNVWTPQTSGSLPVLVFVHGGAWASGGGSVRWYRGQRLAAEGMVVVTLNYRIGPAGHFVEDVEADDDADASGHRPLDDLLLALRWVREKIAEFGGDPDRVTLAGQSAGAWYAWALASLPETAGLIQQVAILSIPKIVPWTGEQRADFSRRAGARGMHDNQVTQQQAVLLAGAKMLSELPRELGAMPPMYLPTLLSEQANILQTPASAAQKMHVKAVYLRVTRHEMSVFLPPEVWTEVGAATHLHALRLRLQGDCVPHHPPPPTWPEPFAHAVQLASWLEFGRFASDIAAAVAQRGLGVVVRDFAALASTEQLGSVHCMDLPFQFGNFDDWCDAPILKNWQRDEFEFLSAKVRADLFSFVAESPDFEPKQLGGIDANFVSEKERITEKP